MPITHSTAGSITFTGNAIHALRLGTAVFAGEQYLRFGSDVLPRHLTGALLRDVIAGYTGQVYARSRRGLTDAVRDGRALLDSTDPDHITPTTAPGA